MSVADTTTRGRVTQRPVPANSTAAAQSSPSDVGSTLGHDGPIGSVDSSNLSYVEALYQSYLQAPESVTPEWADYFAQLTVATTNGPVSQGSLFQAPKMGETSLTSPVQLDAAILQERVDRLIRNYRLMGHFAANLDPLGRPRAPVPELEPKNCGFSESDLDRRFSTLGAGGPNLRTLREITAWLRNTYCRQIGVQFMHIDDIEVREWLQQRMEATENRITLTREEQLRILKRLSDAVVFEEFIQKKFIGAKSFSLEGAETLIPLLELAIYRAADQGVDEIVLGMAHRGRLNVLTSIMGKSPRAVFREFADLDPHLNVGRGDVKYHLGYSNDWYSGDGKKVHLSLCFNPSHLEFVNPVGMGRIRAKQDRRGDTNRQRAMLLLIHGDASFAGEGVVQETLNLNQLESTRIGGTIHVIVNNQLGFTTNPEQARSTPYCSDVAKMLQVPIFHVNGEDPEAVAQVVRLALDFRDTFQRDVVIDMYCYRLRGHNETDVPDFTQPVMYRQIQSHQSVAKSYLERLLQHGEVTAAEAEKFISDQRQQLEGELEVAKSAEYVHKWDMLHGIWKGYKGGPENSVPDVDTGVPVERLSQILEMLTRFPAGFTPHPKLHNLGDPKKPEGILQKRAAMGRGQIPLDWAAGEALAFATLSLEHHRVRLHGQDVERGTFSHRHAMLHDFHTDQTYCPLQHLAVDQAPIEIVNSALSEAGCLGFDYGYSLDYPDGLVCWEAQFGDFVNVAQVIIDQFIASAEDKWNRLSGLTMLLPHGFEGAGPEHSSARLERFLQLCAEDNIQVAYPTTPAQIFHLLRRQVLKKWRKPLIVMTPKYLLRSPDATSSLADLAQGTFQRIIADQSGQPATGIKHVLLCTGKVYYDLAKYRKEKDRHDVAILRLEQLYPLAAAELERLLGTYADGTPITWVQEEPENMGAWWYIRVNLGERVFGRYPLRGVSRAASASPATGSPASHKNEQQEIVERAFGDR